MVTKYDSITRARLSAGVASFALGLGLIAAPAFAQENQSPTRSPEAATVSSVPTGSASSQDQEAGAIVVTGSRIARTDLTSAAPLTVVSQQEFKLTGQVNVENVINSLPQVLPGVTAFSNNPGGGVATLNLRNLGSTRTLVLVNGRRYMFFDTSQQTDLNTIPSFLLAGVDVVTGGASAVYGSDAIAGVVNFRLRTDLSGIEAGTEYQLTERGDGRRYEAHLAIGAATADGRGHVTVYGEYYKRAPIFQGARSYSNFNLLDNGAGGLAPGGSGSVPQGRFAALGTGTGTGTVFASSAIIPVAGQNARTYIGSASAQPNDLYNFAPINYLMVPQQRFLTGGYGEYEVNDHFTGYAEVAFANNRVDSALAATPFTGNYVFNVTAAQSYLSASDYQSLLTVSARQQALGYTVTSANGTSYNINTLNTNATGARYAALSIARRSIEVGLRQNHDDRNSFRVLAGAKGQIIPDWTYDAYYSYSRTRNASVQSGNLSIRAIQSGLLSGSLDIFGPGSITPANVAAIGIQAQNGDISELQVADASVTGKLFNTGMAKGDVSISFGGEWRRMASQFIPDTALSSGDVVGFNASKPTQGDYSVHEVFGELLVPLISDKDYIYRLELHGAARYSKYTLKAVGGVYTYEGDAVYSPFRDVSFRGQYQRAIRAPNVAQLFGGSGQDFPAATDYCAVASARTNATINALCIATGVPAAAVGTTALQPNAQIQGQTGGNPNLKEETSTSYTGGIVLQPHWIPRLNVTVDYYHIKVDNYITATAGGAANILNLCYNVIQNASSAVCQLIKRNPATGIIDGSTGANGTQYVVIETQANIASIKTDGIDLKMDYTQPLNFGIFGGTSKLIADFQGTWTHSLTFQPVQGLNSLQYCAGRFGQICPTGYVQPRFKWSSRVAFVDGPLTTSIRWRHLGAVNDDDPNTTYTVEHIKAFNYYDLTASAAVTDNVTVSLGVANVLNKKPPTVGSQQEQANTYPGTYDVLGRDFFVSAQVKF